MEKEAVGTRVITVMSAVNLPTELHLSSLQTRSERTNH